MKQKAGRPPVAWRGEPRSFVTRIDGYLPLSDPQPRNQPIIQQIICFMPFLANKIMVFSH